MRVGREYSQQEREHFTKYEERRAPMRPKECQEAFAVCWVRQGPPAYSMEGGSSGKCLGCGGKIRE